MLEVSEKRVELCDGGGGWLRRLVRVCGGVGFVGVGEGGLALLSVCERLDYVASV